MNVAASLLLVSCYLATSCRAVAVLPIRLKFPAGHHAQLRGVIQCRKSDIYLLWLEQLKRLCNEIVLLYVVKIK
jgi:hypothetical protein